jgi:hypothetical protein
VHSFNTANKTPLSEAISESELGQINYASINEMPGRINISIKQIMS